MKTWHIVLIVAIGVATLCCGGAGYLFTVSARKSMGDVKVAMDYARTGLTEIGTDWSIETYDRFASVAARKGQDRASTQKYLRAFEQRLGKLTRLGEGEMRNFRMESFTSTGSRTRIEAVFPATFEKGEGRIEVSVIVSEGKPAIYGFNVFSDALIDLK